MQIFTAGFDKLLPVQSPNRSNINGGDITSCRQIKETCLPIGHLCTPLNDISYPRNTAQVKYSTLISFVISAVHLLRRVQTALPRRLRAIEAGGGVETARIIASVEMLQFPAEQEINELDAL